MLEYKVTQFFHELPKNKPQKFLLNCDVVIQKVANY